MKYSVCSVTQVNEHIRDLLDADVTLGALFVRGEISNYKAYPSGHHYFSLKDEGGSLRCVMFRREAATLRFRPQNGMKVVAFGRVSAYPRDGQYQLYVSALQADGVGDLHAAFEELKARLAAQCLFDPEHKKPIPRFPKRIALVTSPAGAAVRDMIRILGARWPMAEAFVVPCRRPPRLPGPSPGWTNMTWPTLLSQAGVAVPWRTCGALMTRGWPGPSTIPASLSFRRWDTSPM